MPPIVFQPECLTHWDRVTHIWFGKPTIIGSDNGLSPDRRQAVIWTNAGILLIKPLGTNFSEILIGIQTFSFKKLHLKTSSAKWRVFWLGLNELNVPVLNKAFVWRYGEKVKNQSLDVLCFHGYLILPIYQRCQNIIYHFQRFNVSF